MSVAASLGELDDIALVREAARGQVAALAELYDRYAALLVTMARRMLGDVTAAEDLVQDVFLEVWRRADGFDPTRGTVRTWMLVRLRSRALDRLRSAQTRREVSRDDVVVSDEDHDELGTQPDRRVVREALAALPAEQRSVLELAYFQGLSSSEIAAQMGTPIGTVKSRTAAALAKLRGVMGSSGRGSEP
jgi:RNA polymerase sigma-70 factor (ECF subfamily)